MCVQRCLLSIIRNREVIMSAKRILVLLFITTLVGVLQQARAQQECLPLFMYMMNSRGVAGVSSPVLTVVAAVLALIIGTNMLDIISL